MANQDKSYKFEINLITFEINLIIVSYGWLPTLRCWEEAMINRGKMDIKTRMMSIIDNDDLVPNGI